MFRFKYQLSPTAQLNALSTDALGFAKVGNASSSKSISETLAASSNAPHQFSPGVNARRGTTGLKEFASPVMKYDAANCHALCSTFPSADVAPVFRRNSCDEMAYSP